jgi:uncharacterized membrane protein YeaQ/YmgE (transglycosylase-associated protein family)
MLSPAVVFLLLLVIGVAAGLLFDRFAGPGWLSRQIAGQNRMMVTSALVGIAGSFVGYHLAVLIGIIGAVALIGAIIGALAVLYGWRMVR